MVIALLVNFLVGEASSIGSCYGLLLGEDVVLCIFGLPPSNEHVFLNVIAEGNTRQLPCALDRRFISNIAG